MGTLVSHHLWQPSASRTQLWIKNQYLAIIEWGWVDEEFCRSRRVLSTEAEFWRHWFNNFRWLHFWHHWFNMAKILSKFGEQQLVMVNYVCGFNQSETEKYFEWIIIIIACITNLQYTTLAHKMKSIQVSINLIYELI